MSLAIDLAASVLNVTAIGSAMRGLVRIAGGDGSCRG